MIREAAKTCIRMAELKTSPIALTLKSKTLSVVESRSLTERPRVMFPPPTFFHWKPARFQAIVNSQKGKTRFSYSIS